MPTADKTKSNKAPRKTGQPLDDPIRERYAGQRAMGSNKTDAFKSANPNSPHMTQASIYVSSCRMDQEPDVRDRKAEILADMLASSDKYLTKAKLAELLSDAIRNALTDELLLSNGAGLVDKYCKMFGFYEPEKQQVALDVADKTIIDAKIAALLKLSLP